MTSGWVRIGLVYHRELAALSQSVKPAWCSRSDQLVRSMPASEMGCFVSCRAKAPIPRYTSEATANIQTVCQTERCALRSRKGASRSTHTPVHLLDTARPTQTAYRKSVV